MARKKTTKRKPAQKKPTKKKKTKTVTVEGGRVNGLPAKQWAFVQEYVEDLNITEAAKRAGYSEATATQIGWQLLQKPDVVQAIEDLLERRARRAGVHADKVIAELACIAFSDITDVVDFTDGGVTIKTSTSLPEKVRRAVGEVREHVTAHGGTVSFKMHSKIEALKELASILKMKKQTVDHNITGDGEAKVLWFPSNGREITEGED